jgi:acyl-CoA synthetase (AMP-forming)/AMP-acid ligase II
METLPSFFKNRTIPAFIKYNARTFPDKTALVAWSGISNKKVLISYKELDNITNKIANAYLTIGVRKSDRIAIFMDNEQGLECILAFYASHKTGAINVPINTRYFGEELQYIFLHCAAKGVITSSKQLPKLLEVIEHCPNLEFIIVVGDIPSDSIDHIKIYPYEKLESYGDEKDPKVVVDETDDADWLYTSGTTGKPKGVMHTHTSSVATGYSVGGAIGITAQDVYQSAFPFFTSSGCHFNPLSVLVYGATFVMDRPFDVKETFRTLQEEKTTIYVGVPAVYSFMLESTELEKYDLSSLRILDYGGAPMPKQVILNLYKKFPHVELKQTYGLTEAGPTGTFLPGEFALVKLGSVGNQGMPLVEIKIVDENNKEVGTNEIGEICYRSPANMKGYFNNDKATKETLVEGWLHSGDLVNRDEDGFIFHVDRIKDTIIRGGFNISSLEVENCLYSHPAVLEVAVIAKPHQHLGEDIKAFVVLRKEMTVSSVELTEFCKNKIADFKVPRDIEFIDSLPRNPMGKVLKTKLRELIH